MSYNLPKLSEHPDWVEVSISFTGICGSDIHTIDAGWGPTNFPVCYMPQLIDLQVQRRDVGMIMMMATLGSGMPSLELRLSRLCEIPLIG